MEIDLNHQKKKQTEIKESVDLVVIINLIKEKFGGYTKRIWLLFH